jgi:Domain of unknown function (DUF5665)
MMHARPDDVSAEGQPVKNAPEHDTSENTEHVRAITREVDRIARIVERMNLGDYVGLLQRPGRLLWLNFLAGLARGLGGILGATLLVSLVLAIAHWIIESNLPGVSEFLTKFVHLLQQNPKGQ